MRRFARAVTSETALAIVVGLFAVTCALGMYVLADNLGTPGRVTKLERPSAKQRRLDIRRDLAACLPSPRCRRDVLEFASALRRAAKHKMPRRGAHHEQPSRRRSQPTQRRSPGASRPTSRRPVRVPAPKRRRRTTPPRPRPSRTSTAPAAPAAPSLPPSSSPPSSGDQPGVAVTVPCIDAGLLRVGC